MSQSALTIYWATDAHMIAEVDNKPSAPGSFLANRLFYTASKKMEKFVARINADRPDLVLFTGDAVNRFDPASFQLFLRSWERIDPAIRKEAVIGNHDLADAPESAHHDLANMFGYGDRPAIAGSKFNQSFGLSGSQGAARILIVDTNMDEHGNHILTIPGLLKPEGLRFIEQELLQCPEQLCLLVSHHGMADNASHFDPADGLAFKEMIDSVKRRRPELVIVNLFGHNHRSGIREYTALGPNVKGYSIPPVVDNMIGYFAKVSITGIELHFELNELPYEEADG